MFSHKTRWVLALALLACGGAAGWTAFLHQKYKHFAVHQPGMVYRAAWLEPSTLSEVIEEHQIRAVVNLCKPGEMGEARWVAQREAVRNVGARLIELSMPTDVQIDDEAIREHLNVMSNPNNYPMLVHCQHGVTRTAKFLSIYDIAFRGMTARDSLRKQPLFGRDDHNVHVRAFVNLFEREHRTAFPTHSPAHLRVLAN